MNQPLSSPMKVGTLTAKVSEAVELLRLMANANRLLLLCRISQGECAVGQLEMDLEIQQPALSQQLAELRKAGLVKTRRESRSIFYSIADARLLTLLPALCAAMHDGPVMRAKTADAPNTRITEPKGDTVRFAKLG